MKLDIALRVLPSFLSIASLNPSIKYSSVLPELTSRRLSIMTGIALAYWFEGAHKDLGRPTTRVNSEYSDIVLAKLFTQGV